MKEIVIVGGGTAGWMAAISLGAHFPDKRVTVIDPSGIPPVGVGESVTGVILQFINNPAHRLDLSEFFRHADATMKHGIRFVDWQGEDTEYLAPIDSPAARFLHYSCEDLEAFYAQVTCEGKSICEVQLDGRLMRAGRTDYIRKPNGAISGEHSAGSCHFDALKFAAWLKAVAPQRPNIRHIDDVMAGFEQDPETGFVRKVITESGEEIGGDFFLDCSGFGRQLFAKAFSPKWIGYSDIIRVDRAIPTFGKLEPGDIPVYTRATAMPNGWAWQIPVGDRLGHGYVFSSRYIDDEGAVEEFRRAGIDVGETPRVIPFEPGKFEAQWEKNVCAIGLAGGFLEALESTTIHIMSSQIKTLTELFLPYYSPEAAGALSRKYNSMMEYMYEDMMDFVSFHYHAGREDTEFWRDYQKPESMTTRNRERMEKWRFALPTREDFSGQLTTRVTLTAGLVVWAPMLCGLGHLRREAAEKFVKSSRHIRHGRENMRRYFKFCDYILENAVTQREVMALHGRDIEIRRGCCG